MVEKQGEIDNSDKEFDVNEGLEGHNDLDGATQKKASVFPQDDHNDLPKRFAPQASNESSKLSETAQERLRVINARKDEMRQTAVTLSKELSRRHNVEIIVLEYDHEYYSNAFIKKSVVDEVYYISAQSPEATAKATDLLIRRERLRDSLLEKKAQERKIELLGIANEKRSGQALQTAQSLNPIVDEIIRTYQETNNGKKPSLRTIAETLTKANVPAPGGSPSWFAQTVKRVLERNKPNQIG